MLTAAFLASLLAISPAEDTAKRVKMIHGVAVPLGYATFFEGLAKDDSEVPKELSKALECFVGEWKGKRLFDDSPPHIAWSVRRAGRNCLVVSETVTFTSNGQPHTAKGKILIGWDAKEKRVKYYSTGARFSEEYISWEVKSPNKWVAGSFKGRMLEFAPPDEIVLEQTGRDEFFIQYGYYKMMAPVSGVTFVRVEPPNKAEEGGAGD